MLSECLRGIHRSCSYKPMALQGGDGKGENPTPAVTNRGQGTQKKKTGLKTGHYKCERSESAGRWRRKLGGGGDALAFGDGVDGVGGDVFQSFEIAVGPADFDFVHDGVGGEAEVQARVAGGEIAGAGFDFFDLRASGGSDGDAGADRSAIALGAHQLE